jgi:hypothetical protein
VRIPSDWRAVWRGSSLGSDTLIAVDSPFMLVTAVSHWRRPFAPAEAGLNWWVCRPILLRLEIPCCQPTFLMRGPTPPTNLAPGAYTRTRTHGLLPARALAKRSFRIADHNIDHVVIPTLDFGIAKSR